MNTGRFYYIKDEYFADFPDPYLMRNKEMINGHPHNRPCFYAFCDQSTGLFWMIPFSSQVEKFRSYYEQKVRKYGKCDTIVFGDVLGHEKAFLIQNICPVTKEYILNEYVDSKTNSPVQIKGTLEKDLISKAKKVIALQRKGVRLIFPDVLLIEQKLIEDEYDIAIANEAYDDYVKSGKKSKPVSELWKELDL